MELEGTTVQKLSSHTLFRIVRKGSGLGFRGPGRTPRSRGQVVDAPSPEPSRGRTTQPPREGCPHRNLLFVRIIGITKRLSSTRNNFRSPFFCSVTLNTRALIVVPLYPLSSVTEPLLKVLCRDVLPGTGSSEEYTPRSQEPIQS